MDHHPSADCVDGQRFRQGLTGQRFCPSMKEVTLHQQEQARLHVLNSVLAEEITIGQAAELMDLSERHARRLLAAYRELGAGALRPRQSRPAPSQRRPRGRRGCCRAPRRHALPGRQPHPPQRAARRAGRHRPQPPHGAAHPDAGRHAQPEAAPPATAPRAARAHAERGDAAPGRRQPPRLARATRPALRPPARRRPPRRGRPWLLPADRAGAAPLRHPARPLQRSPRRLPGLRPAARGRRGVHPVRAGDGGAGGPPDLRPLTAGQGPGGAHGGHVPGPPRDRTAPRLSHHHRRGAGRARALPPALQCALRRRRQPARAGLAAARPGTSTSGPSSPSGTPAASRATTPSSTTGARCSCCPQRSGPATPGRAWTCSSAQAASSRCATGARTIPSRLAPPRSGVLRERRSELARDPALERLALGLGSGVAPPDQPELPAAANGTAANGASPQARVKPLRPPIPRQQTLWKAIRQAQLQGLSMRATARVLGISRNTVRSYLRAGGPPGRQGAASSTSNDQRERTFSLNR